MDNTSAVDSAINELSGSLSKNGFYLVTAESCTGGMLSAALTGQPGSSKWFEGGFITYSNTAKEKMLGVSAQIHWQNMVLLVAKQ